MNRTVFKIFFCFTLTAAVIAVIIMVINVVGIGSILNQYGLEVDGHSPAGTVKQVASGLRRDEDGFALPEEFEFPESYWCILLDDDGDVAWSANRPEDIPTHYSLTDIARLTKWYLNDYPVYVWTTDYGLLILGVPHGSVAKYDLQFTREWFDSLPQRIAAILFINLVLATILAVIFGARLYKRLKQVTNGVKDLRDEKTVQIPERGIFKELARNLNQTSNVIHRKNQQLAIRDGARQNWTAGISHDIRTPLAIVMGNAETLERDEALLPDSRQKAAVIVTQSMKVKRLVEDLNLISALEYDRPARRNQPVKICPLIRGIVTDIINSGLSEEYEIHLDLRFEAAVVLGDESLLERALFNLIHNAIAHNPKGCRIEIAEHKSGDRVMIQVRDDGAGVPEEVLEHMDRMPQTTHGIGLPLVWRIVNVHGGIFEGRNEGGFCGKLELPIAGK